MASFFGEVVAQSYRYFDDEDEDLAQEMTCRKFSTSGSTSKVEKSLLLVAEGKLASVYTEIATQLQPVELLLAQTEGGASTEIGKIFRGPGYTAVTVDKDLSMVELNSLGELVLQMVDPSSAKLVCLTSRHISEYRGEGESDEGVVRCLSTKPFPSISTVKRLEVPNILTGLSAAILSVSAVKSIAASLLISYVDTLVVDSLTLHGFERVHELPCLQQAGLSKPANLSTALKKLKPNTISSNLYM